MREYAGWGLVCLSRPLLLSNRMPHSHSHSHSQGMGTGASCEHAYAVTRKAASLLIAHTRSCGLGALGEQLQRLSRGPYTTTRYFRIDYHLNPYTYPIPRIFLTEGKLKQVLLKSGLHA